MPDTERAAVHLQRNNDKYTHATNTFTLCYFTTRRDENKTAVYDISDLNYMEICVCLSQNHSHDVHVYV